jgi:Protein of unknown function (DUF3293)
MDKLILAYTNTTYRVFAPEPFDLRIGKWSSTLQNLMQATGSECCAFLSAYNPWSIEHHVGANNERHAELRTLTRPAPYYEGVGFSENSEMPWMPERGMLVLQQEYPDTAYTLMRLFNQHAFVWCDESCVPQLLLTGDTETERKLVSAAHRAARGG